MRKVVESKESIAITPIADVDHEKYYGAGMEGFVKEEKAFIIRENYDSGEFKVYVADEMTNGNALIFQSRSLKDLIRTLMNESYEVYEFDTSTELFKWLSE